MTQIRIVGLGGSSSPRSSTAAALEQVLAGARDAGAEVTRFDVATMELPFFEYGNVPPAVSPYIEAVRAAHGMVWSSPLYHGSVSGTFKNAIDWLELLSRDDPPYLSNKIVALVATSAGDQALQAINSMEFIVRALRGWTLPLTAPIARADAAFDEHGKPRDAGLAERLRSIGAELVRSSAVFAR